MARPSGSVIGVSNDLGRLVEAYTYSPYGEHTRIADPLGIPMNDVSAGTPVAGGTSSIGNPFTFTGRPYDAETGFQNYRTRYYWPELGRFVSVDSIGNWGDLANYGNGYVYVAGNPAGFVDPMGQSSTNPQGCKGCSESQSWDYQESQARHDRKCDFERDCDPDRPERPGEMPGIMHAPRNVRTQEAQGSLLLGFVKGLFSPIAILMKALNVPSPPCADYGTEGETIRSAPTDPDSDRYADLADAEDIGECAGELTGIGIATRKVT